MLMLHEHDVVRGQILQDLVYTRYSKSDPTFACVHAAIGRLREWKQHNARMAVSESFGTVPTVPDISIVVPLYRRIDLLEHQLAQFANDDELQDAELMYVLDSPELADELWVAATELFD